MHEAALAQAVVEQLSEELRARRGGNVRISRIKLRVGELYSLDKEIVVQWIKELGSRAGLSIGNIEVEVIPARFKCRICGHEWSLSDYRLDSDTRELVHFVPDTIYAYMKCPSCSGRLYDLVAGREFSVEAEVEQG